MSFLCFSKLCKTTCSRAFFLLTLASAVAFQGEIALSQYVEVDSFNNPNLVVTLGSAPFLTDQDDDSSVFQSAIDEVESAGGGHVIVPPDTYSVVGVRLKSEVHLLFDGQSTVGPNLSSVAFSSNASNTTSVNLFEFGTRRRIVRNASIRGINNWSRFEMQPDLSRPDNVRMRAFSVSNAENFLISNVNVVEARTEFSGLVLGWAGDDSGGTAQIPTNGRIEHLRCSNAHYGYGAIQAHASRNVEFEDIEAIGGVALRLETGSRDLNLALARASRRESSVDNITANDIRSFHGQASLLLSPHAMSQGTVNATNVTSVGSEYAVLVSSGNVRRYTADQISTLGLQDGSYESINIDGVTAIAAQGLIETRFAHLDHYPEEFHRVGTVPSLYRIVDPGDGFYPNGHFFRGPSITAISSTAPAPTANTWEINIANITSAGFLFHPEFIGPSDFSLAGTRNIFTDLNTVPDPDSVLPPGRRLVGDINNDRVWDAADVDLLSDEIGLVTPGGNESSSVAAGGAFDLVNQDGVAGQDDFVYLLRSILASEFGDANLDGRVSFLDVEIIANNFEQPGGWGAGDFNNDGIVDRQDIDILELFYQPHVADEQLSFEDSLARVGLSPVLIGDVNRDGVVDFQDISPFIAILSGGTFLLEADIDENGVVDFSDIPSFISLLQQ